MKLITKSGFGYDGSFSIPRIIVRIHKNETLGDYKAKEIFEEFNPLIHPGDFIVAAIKELGMSFTVSERGNYYRIEFFDGVTPNKTLSEHQNAALEKIKKIVDYVIKYKELKKAFGM